MLAVWSSTTSQSASCRVCWRYGHRSATTHALLQEAEAAAGAATDVKQGAVRRKSRPLTSALVSLRSRRSSAVQSLMYDEDGNRRRLFGGSTVGGAVSSGDSASSQAREAMKRRGGHG